MLWKKESCVRAQVGKGYYVDPFHNRVVLAGDPESCHAAEIPSGVACATTLRTDGDALDALWQR